MLSIEVGIAAGKRWRPVMAVSKHPTTGWAQTDVDAVLQTKWEGLYRDTTIYHVATPAFYQLGGKWYLYTQACPLPGNGNYIDGHWDLWCFACDRRIPTLPGYESIYVPGPPTARGRRALTARGGACAGQELGIQRWAAPVAPSVLIACCSRRSMAFCRSGERIFPPPSSRT